MGQATSSLRAVQPRRRSCDSHALDVARHVPLSFFHFVPFLTRGVTLITDSLSCTFERLLSISLSLSLPWACVVFTWSTAAKSMVFINSTFTFLHPLIQFQNLFYTSGHLCPIWPRAPWPRCVLIVTFKNLFFFCCTCPSSTNCSIWARLSHVLKLTTDLDRPSPRYHPPPPFLLHVPPSEHFFFLHFTLAHCTNKRSWKGLAFQGDFVSDGFFSCMPVLALVRSPANRPSALDIVSHLLFPTRGYFFPFLTLSSLWRRKYTRHRNGRHAHHQWYLKNEPWIQVLLHHLVGHVFFFAFQIKYG